MLISRTGWCTHVNAYGLPGLPSNWVKLRPGGAAAVLRPAGQWDTPERKIAARVEQERFMLAALQHADRMCLFP